MEYVRDDREEVYDGLAQHGRAVCAVAHDSGVDVLERESRGHLQRQYSVYMLYQYNKSTNTDTWGARTTSPGSSSSSPRTSSEPEQVV